MFELLSKAIFLDVLAIYMFGLYLLNKGRPKRIISRKPQSNRMDSFLDALPDLVQIVPLIYIFAPWLDFADYRLSSWFSWAGVLLFMVALWLLGKAHSTLGNDFSPRMEIRNLPEPMNRGIYRYIRHPIYAGFWLWGIAQPLLLHNWIAGFATLAIFLLLYWLRAPQEDKILVSHFGEAYRKYMRETGRVLLRLRHALQPGGTVERGKARD